MYIYLEATEVVIAEQSRKALVKSLVTLNLWKKGIVNRLFQLQITGLKELVVLLPLVLHLISAHQSILEQNIHSAVETSEILIKNVLRNRKNYRIFLFGEFSSRYPLYIPPKSCVL